MFQNEHQQDQDEGHSGGGDPFCSLHGGSFPAKRRKADGGPPVLLWSVRSACYAVKGLVFG